MAIRYILKDPDPALRKKSRLVTVFDHRIAQLLDDMRDTLAQAGGVGLAAPQVGVLRRVILVEGNDGTVREFINPEIIFAEKEEEGQEGCLSIPGEWGIVKRPHHVKVRAFDRNGKEFIREGFDLEAVCLCHESDHLDGVLYTDKAIRMLDPKEK